MEELYQWVGSILCYLILVSAVRAVLPSKKYEKYIRFFIGVVLILLVVQPVMGGVEMEDRLAYYFETIGFQRESEELKREILGVEEKRLERVIVEYEKAVEREIGAMAEDMGFLAENVEVSIEREQGREDYGMVNRVFMVVKKEVDSGGEGDGRKGVERDGGGGEVGEKAEEAEVEEIQIGTIRIETEAAVGQFEGVEVDGEKELAGGEGGKDLEQLRGKVERYYGLEDWQVEIEFKGW